MGMSSCYDDDGGSVVMSLGFGVFMYLAVRCMLEQQGNWAMCLQYLAGLLRLLHMVAGFQKQ